MKFFNYFVFRFYGLYRDTTPVFLIWFGLTSLLTSICAILINTLEMLLGYKLLSMETFSWLVVPVFWVLIWLWIYLMYIRNGRYKTFHFIETKKARFLKGAGLVLLISGSFICAMWVYAERFEFFGDITK